MNILIVGGRKKVDFLARSLLSKGHRVTIVHDNEDYCKYLSRTHDIPVICGDGSKLDILEEADIHKAKIIITMTPKDADNLVICQIAKKVYGVKRAFATVNNPKNVEVFRKLGINSALSATYIVAGIIEQMAAMDEISNYIPIEQSKVVVMEIMVRDHFPVIGKALSDIKFPEEAIIGCIIRGVDSFIPRGRTIIQADDKLIVLSPPEIQKDIIKQISGRTDF